MERVKQGDPDAIASLMNRTLPHHLNQASAHVQIRRRGGEYRLLVEAPQVPDKQATIKWVMHGLTKLAIAPMQTVTIYGKSEQSAKPHWQYSFRLGSSATLSPAHAKVPSATPLEKPLDLSEHCLIRNRSLLSGDLTPPAKAVTRLIVSFAALPDVQKLAVLPRLTQLLRQPEPLPGNEALEAGARAWIIEVLALDGNGLRQLSIWVSRYCVHPAETVKQLSPAVDEGLANADDLSEPLAPSRPVGTAVSPAVSSVIAAQAARAEQLRSPETMLDQNSWLSVWVIPVAWALCLMVVVTLGIQSANRTNFSFPICEQAGQLTVRSTAECTLAVQLVGSEKSMADTIKAAVPLAPAVKAAAAKNCSSYAKAHVISALKIDGLAPPLAEDVSENAVDIASSQTTEVFPGVVLTEVMQARSLPKIDSLSQIGNLSQSGALLPTDSAASKETMRIACVGYSFAPAVNNPALADDASASGETQSAFKEIAADEIPAAWPAEPYDQATALNSSTENALGVYDIFISFGANTLFTAIGVFVAVMLFSCYRCYTLTGVYQVAAVLGAVETVVYMIPNVGLFLSLPLGVAAIGLASRLVKDFNIDWTEGYKSLARGAITIVAIRYVFSWLMYGAIAHFIT